MSNLFREWQGIGAGESPGLASTSAKDNDLLNLPAGFGAHSC